MKLIDSSLNSNVAQKSYEKFMYASFVGKTIDLIPNITEVGCIIRVHRGRNKKSRGVFELNCSINGIGAWALFSLDDSKTEPIQKSGKSYTFTENDEENLTQIREFGKEFFKKYDIQDDENLSNAISKNLKDFSVICMILDINYEGNLAYIKIYDNKNEATLEIAKKKTESLKKFDVINIVNVDFKNKDTIIMNEYSNIMKIPNDFKISQKLKDNIPENSKS